MADGKWQSTLLYTLGALIVLLNISTAVLNYASHRPQRRTLRDYSGSHRTLILQILSERRSPGFKDDDYPAYYPITLEAGILTPEDTRHYHIWANESAREFGLTFPRSGGFVFLGPEKRPFGVALYHQMYAVVPPVQASMGAHMKVCRHCLERIQHALINHTTGGHVHHCRSSCHP